MSIRIGWTCILAGSLLAGSGIWRATAPDDSPTNWTPLAAAQYLDQREIWWQNWPRAQKDQGTICISCHTQLPYAMVRPVLERELGETGMNPAEKTMMDSVEKRVSRWFEMIPFYSDEKSGPG